MALVKCVACEKEYSKQVKKCPNCGHDSRNWFRRHPILSFILIFFSISFFGFLVDDSKKKPVSTNNSNEIRQVATKEEKVYSMNQEVELENFRYKINSIKYKKTVGNEFFNSKADGIYLIIDLTILNKSNETKILDSSLFKLSNPSEVSFEPSTEASTALTGTGKNVLFLKQIQPGIKTSGVIVFEVPAQSKYYLAVSNGFWGGDSAKIKIF